MDSSVIVNEKKSLRDYFLDFISKNTTGGILLVCVAVFSIIFANNEFTKPIFSFFERPIVLKFGSFSFFSSPEGEMTVNRLINDGLMSIFFFYVGLEIKREILVGELSNIKRALLPIICAIGGMIVPMIIYSFICNDGLASRGIAIPMATDIAFSLGILSLFGRRVPIGLKIFLTALALADDIGGIIIIAIFYNSHVIITYLLIGLGLVISMKIVNVLKITNNYIYIILGLFAWYFIYRSGIHSTIAGVLCALTIPAFRKISISEYINQCDNLKESLQGMRENQLLLSEHNWMQFSKLRKSSGKLVPPLQYWEHKLGIPVNYFILPLFAFANASVIFTNSSGPLFGEVFWGIFLGLFLGKMIGIYSFARIFSKIGLGYIPSGVTKTMLFGVSIIAGVGFTVSFFIANLSFSGVDESLFNQSKLGIIIGSLCSGIIGFFVLKYAFKKQEKGV